MFETLAALLCAAVISVPLTRRGGLGSVLGYLIGGAVIGPSVLRLVTDVDAIAQVSELGVVMLLFLIGLELRPQRLWVMRRSVFGLGTAQVVVTAAALAALGHAVGLQWTEAVVIGGGLAMSSTAIVLPMLGERDLLSSEAGRQSFAVLLFQDLAFIPMVALVPLLAEDHALAQGMHWRSVAGGVAAIALILVGGRFLLRPAFRIVASLKTPEVFTATALLTVVGAASIAHAAGLSTSLGAFLAGVLLADSEFRHELQADIEPFEGLLLGFFFMAVGMSADLSLALSAPGAICVGVAGLLTIKVAIAFLLSRATGQSKVTAGRFAVALSQGSEFSFVMFGAAIAAGILSEALAAQATLVIGLSMAATPILFAIFERLVQRFAAPRVEPEYDEIDSADAPVIICGFGRVGQIVGRVLRMQGIAFTALERDSAQIEFVRRFGSKVYFGDPTRADLLRAAGAEQARLLVVALDDMETTLEVVDTVRRNFPKLKLLVRARNRRHVFLLMDRGIDRIIRDTYYSSLKLSEMVLQDLGVAEDTAKRAVEIFDSHDQAVMHKTHAFYEDERKLIQSSQEAAAELAQLFEADRQESDVKKTG